MGESGLEALVSDVALADFDQDALRDPIVFTHVTKYRPGALVFAGCTVDYDLGPKSHSPFGLEVVAFQSDHAIRVRARGDDAKERCNLELLYEVVLRQET